MLTRRDVCESRINRAVVEAEAGNYREASKQLELTTIGKTKREIYLKLIAEKDKTTL